MKAVVLVALVCALVLAVRASDSQINFNFGGMIPATQACGGSAGSEPTVPGVGLTATNMWAIDQVTNKFVELLDTAVTLDNDMVASTLGSAIKALVTSDVLTETNSNIVDDSSFTGPDATVEYFRQYASSLAWSTISVGRKTFSYQNGVATVNLVFEGYEQLRGETGEPADMYETFSGYRTFHLVKSESGEWHISYHKHDLRWLQVGSSESFIVVEP